MTLDDIAVVTIRPDQNVFHGTLAVKDERLVAEWIAKNAAALIDIGMEPLARAL